MGIRVFKPTSPARRFQTCSDFADVTTDKPLRKLVEAQSKSGGRNHFGRITTRFRGGGHKRRYRVIDFRRSKIGVPAKVVGGGVTGAGGVDEGEGVGEALGCDFGLILIVHPATNKATAPTSAAILPDLMIPAMSHLT